MAREARIIVPEYPHHVVQRAVDGKIVFCNDEDYIFFLRHMNKWVEKMKIKLLAYCIMNNHFHLLLIPSDKSSLGKCLHGMSFIYAQRYNNKTNRKGILWQSRYYSCPVDFGEHLWVVSRYIERNPVRAGLIKSPTEWKWSSAKYNIEGLKDNNVTNIERWLNENDRIEYSNFTIGDVGEEEVRKHTISSRPFGSMEFIEKVSNMLGIVLVVKKMGRPKKKEEKVGTVPTFSL